jgi:allantoicase
MKDILSVHWRGEMKREKKGKEINEGNGWEKKERRKNGKDFIKDMMKMEEW